MIKNNYNVGDRVLISGYFEATIVEFAALRVSEGFEYIKITYNGLFGVKEKWVPYYKVAKIYKSTSTDTSSETVEK